MKIFVFILLLLSWHVDAQEVYGSKHYQDNKISDFTVVDDSLQFFVLGDWGRNGHFYQRDVAIWMDIAAYQMDPDFIATTGDNFYDNGVASVSDPYWQTSFEQVYHGPHLFIDWHPVLGNHDYLGNWQAQIDYSSVSRRWQMPSQYYSKQHQLEDGSEVLLLFLDTSPLNPRYAKRSKYAETQKQDGSGQMQWLHSQLANSTAKWKIVIGHHPLYSSGKRYGKTDEMRSVLEPVFERYDVDAYFAGHEHDMQHNRSSGKKVHHFISGGGSEIRPVGQKSFTKFAASTGGFATVSIKGELMLTQIFDHNGKVIYRHQISKGKK